MSVFLTIAFEVGAAASLASLVILDRMNKAIVWSLFLLLTSFQIMSNVYYAFIRLVDYQGWVDLFGLTSLDPIMQKRILAIVSGALLPIIALGFIKSLVDYIRPTDEKDANDLSSDIDESKNLVNLPKEDSEKTLTKMTAEHRKDESAAFNESTNNEINEPDKETEQAQEKNSVEQIPDVQRPRRTSIEEIQDPKLRDIANEYINKTMKGSVGNPKTIPGIS